MMLLVGFAFVLCGYMDGGHHDTPGPFGSRHTPLPWVSVGLPSMRHEQAKCLTPTEAEGCNNVSMARQVMRDLSLVDGHSALGGRHEAGMCVAAGRVCRHVQILLIAGKCVSNTPAPSCLSPRLEDLGFVVDRKIKMRISRCLVNRLDGFLKSWMKRRR